VRLREFSRMGFSGFEGRYYSLFPTFGRDMALATSLQQLLLMVAYQLALDGSVRAEDIPDDPTSESERRQPFFFAAAGLPAFYVHKRSRNELLKKILRHCGSTRSSWRHPDYLRVPIADYRDALLVWLTENARVTITQAQAELIVVELRFRLADQNQQAHSRVLNGILEQSGARNPLKLPSREFNQLAEHYYRETLRRENLCEAFEHLREDAQALAKSEHPEVGAIVRHSVRVQDPVRFLDSIGERFVADKLTEQEAAAVLNLLLLLSALEGERNSKCEA
jgi:hypothetical protein